MTQRFLVTGCAGFIASKVTDLLLLAGHAVVGVDSLNDAYDPRLKRWRLAQLQGRDNFRFHQLDISDRAAVEPLFAAVGSRKFASFAALMSASQVGPSTRSAAPGRFAAYSRSPGISTGRCGSSGGEARM